MATVEDRDEKRAAADRRRLALHAAAEVIAKSKDVDRITSLLSLANGHSRLVRAIERAKLPAPPTRRGDSERPDRSVWAEAADLLINQG